MPKRTTPLKDITQHELEDDEYAVAYLNAAIEESIQADDPRGILVALRRIAEIKGLGMTQLANDLNVDRAGLYKTLSEQGNPQFLTLFELFKALGIKPTFQKLDSAA